MGLFGDARKTGDASRTYLPRSNLRKGLKYSLIENSFQFHFGSPENHVEEEDLIPRREPIT